MTQRRMTRPEAGAAEVARITQDDIDALWLAARVVIEIGDAGGHGLRRRAQLRIQHLMSAGVIECGPGVPPAILETTHDR